MAKRRKRSRQQEATAWPKGLTEEQLARFVSTHDLSKIIGTGRTVQVDFAPAALAKTRGKPFKRIPVAFRLERQDLERIKQIARERDIPYTALMRSWLRAGLRRERVKQASFPK